MKNHLLKSEALALIFSLLSLGLGHATQPSVTNSIGDRLVPTNGAPVSINLSQHIRADAGVNLVRVTTDLSGSNGTPLGFTLRLLPSNAPLTVGNFLSYVNDGAYENMLIHRSVPGFVIQTGGYDYGGGNIPTWTNIVPSEASNGLSNVRGTVAMALVGTNSNSANSQWFVNLTNNSSILDRTNTAGNPPFTVFAQVLGSEMTTLDAIAALPRFTNLNAPFNELPIRSTNTTNPLGLSNLLHVTRVATIPFFALSSDTTAYAPRISNSTLFIDYTGGTNPPTNPVTITVVATDTNGLTASDSFQVFHLSNQVRSINYPTNADQQYSTNGFDMAFYPYSSDRVPLPVNGISWNTNLARFAGYTNGYNHFSILGTGTITFTYVQPASAIYRAVTNTTSFVVSRAQQHITFPALTTNSSNTVVYTTNPYILSNAPTSSSTLPVSLSIAPGSPATWRVSNTQLLFSGVGTITLVANQSGNSNYLSATPVTNTLIVTKAPQRITFPQLTNQVLTAAKADSLIPLRAVSDSGASVRYSVNPTNSAKITNSSFLYVLGANTVAVEASLPESANYLAATPVTNTVSCKYLQMLRPFEKLPGRTYSPNLSFPVRVPVSTNSNLTGVVLSATPTNIATVVSNSVVNINGAGTVTLTATLQGNDIFFPASVSTSFVVAKSPQYIPAPEIIAAQNNSRLSNGIAPLSVRVPSASSGLPVRIVASGAGFTSTNGTNVMINLTNAGKLTLTARQDGDSNYLQANSTATTYTIAKGNQTINFPDIDTNNARPGRGVFLEARAVPSGLPVSYRIVNGMNAARLNNGNQVLIQPTGSGTVTIVASQPGSSGYNPAVPVTKSFIIATP